MEYILSDFFAARGYDPKLVPMYAQMLVGMVAMTGQWWLDARKPKMEEVAAHLHQPGLERVVAAGDQAADLQRGGQARPVERARGDPPG